MFDVKRIMAEAQAAPPFAQLAMDVAIAIVDDCFRLAGRVPPKDDAWSKWTKKATANWPDQIQVLAWLLATTSLREATVEAVRLVDADPKERLEEFYDQIEPLTGEMLRTNAFRQEEMLRKWAVAWRAPIAGEQVMESAMRLERLDYRKALVEFERAEAVRRTEAEKRAKELAEAAAREEAARGWRE
jgi:hypothetical protein